MNTTIKFIYFDVFGTVVDWYSSVKAQLEAYFQAHDIAFDAGLLTMEWRKLYGPYMQRVVEGEMEWTPLDDLQALSFGELVDRYSLPVPASDFKQIALFWHYMEPWPDSVPGLNRLKQKYTLVTLSNGNVRLLADMAKHANLPWDVILASDIPRAYKRNPEFFDYNLGLIGDDAYDAVFVAAHAGDMRAARERGMRAAYVRRPQMYGPYTKHYQPDPGLEVDYIVDSLTELADILAGE